MRRLPVDNSRKQHGEFPLTGPHSAPAQLLFSPFRTIQAFRKLQISFRSVFFPSGGGAVRALICSHFCDFGQNGSQIIFKEMYLDIFSILRQALNKRRGIVWRPTLFITDLGRPIATNHKVSYHSIIARRN